MSDQRPPSPSQLRRDQRLPVELSLTYRCAGASRPQAGVTRDISAGGLLFESAQAIAANAILTICFELVPGTRVELDGRTVSTFYNPATKTHVHRVAFTAVPPGVRDTILRFVMEAWRADLMRQM